MSFFKKYKIPLIILLFLYILTIALPLILLPGQTGPTAFAAVIRYIPNTLNDGQVIAFIFAFDTLAFIIGALVSGYLLGPVYLYIHKFIIGRKKVYDIQERPLPQDEKFKGIFRGFFPTLLAVNLTLSLADYPVILNLVVDIQVVPFEGALNAIIPFMLGLSIALFAPAWSLRDTRILSSNERKAKETGELLEIQSIGGWYLGFLKGYAGLTTIFSLFLLVSSLEYTQGIIGMAFSVAVLGVVPIYTIVALPAIVLFDVTGEHRRKFLLRIARKIGITESLEI